MQVIHSVAVRNDAYGIRVTGYCTVEKYEYDPKCNGSFGPPFSSADNFASLDNFKVAFFRLSGW
jgi:hypothetical protein